MHGCGNDFVIFDERTADLGLAPGTIARLADRHRGIGCDQLITIRSEPNTGAIMRIFNADGSTAGACGNATRCVADILMRETRSDEVVVTTIAGTLPAHRRQDGSIEVDMGPVRLDWTEIPLSRPMDTLHVDLPGDPACASMGNPHATFFVEDIDAVDVPATGRRYELDPLFPERANIGFAQVVDPATVRLRVWERGAGLTLACGSGACAALVNAARRGLTGNSARMIMDGGILDITWRSNGHVLMAGPATTAFSGEVDLP